MTYIGLGCLCFLFFILYDLNQIHKNHRGIRPLFAVGCITLCVLTITMSVTEFESDYQVTFPAVAVFSCWQGYSLCCWFTHCSLPCLFRKLMWRAQNKKFVRQGYMHCADTRGCCSWPDFICFCLWGLASRLCCWRARYIQG